ncbi:type II toxin-antitoxin system VapC family toxin [Longimicrobium sp.]|uniref:type II toxin-antitoxin system VapC family toxin n=1 Tax=Longimicrobium sp. TaxID=2029185 RepID=UPI002BD643CF|nr:PIN domain-containing protein [Longimicrobium sp.]HSU17881.1 PIN domain-containing protein [Longimicrobium sp.]
MGFILDTNLYIDADREPSRAEALAAFYDSHLPSTHLHAIVVQEMLAGAISPERARRAQESLIRPFEKRNRLIVPTYETWKRAGEILRQLAVRGFIAPGKFARSFIHDVMLAASCRQFGHTLVTANLRDFELIRKVERFDFVPPFPN